MAEEKTVVVATTKPVKEKTAVLEKKVETSKKTEKKAASQKAAVEKPVAVQKAAEPKKAAVKKEAPKKASSKKTASKTAAKKTTSKEALKDELHIQMSGKSYTEEDLKKIAKDVWVYDMQQKASDFKSVALYVKPEEMKVYFVVNGNESGSFLI